MKLNYIDTFNTKRCEVAVRYSQKLKKIEKLALPPIVDGHVFHQYTVRVEGDNRDELQQFLKARDIQTNVYFPVPQNELPVYTKKLVLKNSHQMARHVLSLPMWPHLTEQVQDRVVNAIVNFFGVKTLLNTPLYC